MQNSKINSVSLKLSAAVSVVLGLAGGSLPMAAFAQAAAADAGLEEVVVTAQRREQNSQDVGVSLSALSGKDLRKLGITDSSDISKAIAGVTLNPSIGGGAANSNLVVRGVAQTDLSATAESPNSIYIDDVYLSSPNAAGFAVYDLARVEVLRGPQGTLFGRASSGGLANFITTRPSKEWGGFAEVSRSSYNDTRVEAAIGGPLSDTVRFRLSGGLEKADGWLKNSALNTPAQYEKNSFGIRGQLEADLSDALTARIALSYDKSPRHREGTYISTPAYFNTAIGSVDYLPANVQGDYLLGLGLDHQFYRDTDGDTFSTGFNDVGYLENERVSPTLYLTYNLGEATLTSITNYTKFKFDYQEDADGSALVSFVGSVGDSGVFNYSQDLDQYSQELRINGVSGDLNYTVGMYYLKTSQVQPQAFPVPSFGITFTNDVSQSTNSWAVFGQVEKSLTEKLKLTGGLRFTKEKKQFASRAYGFAFGATPTAANIVYDYTESNPAVGSLANLDDNLWSGKIGLDYQPDENSLVYASVSRGVKGGGYNTNLNGFPDQKFLDANGGVNPFGTGNVNFIPETRYAAENLMAYEAGVKLDLMDKKLRVNASTFYYDYKNFQGYNFRGVAGIVANTDGRFYGAELEIAARPLKGLDINLAASLLDTKLYDVSTAYKGIRDTQAAQAPKVTVNGSVTKSFDLPFGSVAITWDGNYLGDRYTSTDNHIGTLIRGSFVHNARVVLNLASQGVEVAAFVKNISNKDRMVFSYDTNAYWGNLLQGFAPPRWVGVSVRKTF